MGVVSPLCLHADVAVWAKIRGAPGRGLGCGFDLHLRCGCDGTTLSGWISISDVSMHLRPSFVILWWAPCPASASLGPFDTLQGSRPVHGQLLPRCDPQARRPQMELPPMNLGQMQGGEFERPRYDQDLHCGFVASHAAGRPSLLLGSNRLTTRASARHTKQQWTMALERYRSRSDVAWCRCRRCNWGSGRRWPSDTMTMALR